MGGVLKKTATALSKYVVAPQSFAFAMAAAALSVGAAAPAAQADPKDLDRTPALCDMVRAFDAALQLRYYRANYAPDNLECHFYGDVGCTFSVPQKIAIKITHIEPLGCDDGGCAFIASQTCVSAPGSGACRAIMPAQSSTYRVSGRFTSHADAHWRLTEWTREPSAPMTAGEKVAVSCPQLLKS